MSKIDIAALLERCKNKRANARNITLGPSELETLIHRLQDVEVEAAESAKQLVACQFECHTIRRAYLHEKYLKEAEFNLAHMLLKALEIADHDDGTGGGQMAKQWMTQAIASLPVSPVMLMSTCAFSGTLDDPVTRDLRVLLDHHMPDSKKAKSFGGGQTTPA